MSAPADDLIQLGENLVPQGSRGVAFLISTVAHCAFFFLLPQLASVRFFADEPPLKLFTARVQSLNLRITEPLYEPPPPPPPPRRDHPLEGEKKSGTGTKVIEAAAAEPESGSAAPDPAPAKPTIIAKKFEMPAPVRPAAENQPAILQPPAPSIGVPVQQLPKVVAWNDPVLPRPKPKTFVTPGRREKVPEKPPELTAPPTLDVSARGGAASPINIAAAPQLPRPRLAMPPSRTMPVRIPDAPPELKEGQIGSGTGDPANLIILSATAGKAGEVVSVPPGSNIPRTATEGAASGTGGNGNGNGHGAGTGSGAGGSFGNRGGGIAGNGVGGAGGLGKSGSGTGSAGAGTGAASTGRSQGSNGGPSGSAAGVAGSSGKLAAVIPLSAPPPGASPTPPPPMTRGPVKTGVFDVVVVQSAAAETQFRSFGILRGKPIYTVYLQLGMPKAWILQYCLPANSAAVSAQAGVVRLEDPQAVTPPYPVATVLSEVELQPKSSYTLIHGFLTSAGKFRNMSLMGKTDQQLSRLLQLLEKWEFRPALKGDAPAEVEVLLAIPPV